MARKARIVGLVTRGGPALVQGRREDGRWDVPRLSAMLRPWREEGGPIRTDELRVGRRTRMPYGLWQLLMPAGRAIALTVDLEEGAIPTAELRRYRFWRRRGDLEAARRGWLAERQLTDPRFGRFAFDERILSFEGRAVWCGREVALSIPYGEAPGGGEAEALQVAYRLFDAAEAWDARIRGAIAAELLALYNEGWRGSEEPPLKAAEFLSRISLEAISVGGPELVSFYFDDGGLFAGHTIDVGLWLDEDTIDVSLAG